MRYLLLLCSIVLASNFAGVVIEDGANVSGLVFTSGVTVNTGFTTKLENDMWGSNGFKETIGGGSGREDELILKQNTVYLRCFISGADNNIIQFKASWYEHTSLN